MSVKHVKAYYEEICNQYHDFIEELKDFEELCASGMVSPETIEMAKKTIEPLKDNWMKLNYVMWLLNKPNRKENAKKYAKQIKPTEPYITDKQVFEQNAKCIENLNSLKS